MTTLYRDINLFSQKIKGNLLLAPLAGYSDAAFRSVCNREGASFGFTEMISAEAIHRGNTKTLDLVRRGENELQYGIQLFTSNIPAAISCLKLVEQYRPAVIDINCGCSVPKILRAGCGAALMQKPDFIGELAGALSDNSSIPISVKLRLGWDNNSITYLEAAEKAVKNGAAMVSLHPRTRAQAFTGKSDWTHLARLKKHVDVPVIGSGDLFTAADAEKMLRETQIDGVMFARGAIGNPFLFSETIGLLRDGTLPPPVSDEKRLLTALDQLIMMASFKSGVTACREMRKHFAHYVKGMNGAGILRQKANSCDSVAEYKEMIAEYLANNN